jgi:hypothetical protein
MLLILGMVLDACACALVGVALVASSNGHREDAKVMALIAIAIAIIGSGLMHG